MGAWELLAAVTTTTATTISTTTTTTATTTTLVQAAGGQGDTPVWIPLVAALLGAVVGGLLALYGSVLVNRWEVRRTARFRMYQELLPRIKNDTWPPFRWRGEGREEFEKSIDALMRAATVAGPLEWRDALWSRSMPGGVPIRLPMPTARKIKWRSLAKTLKKKQSDSMMH